MLDREAIELNAQGFDVAPHSRNLGSELPPKLPHGRPSTTSASAHDEVIDASA
jgi:hypothetical protein